MKIQTVVFWGVTSCRLVGGHQYLRGMLFPSLIRCVIMTCYEYDLFKICCFNKSFAIEDYLIIKFLFFYTFMFSSWKTNFMHYHKSGNYVVVQL
jgi:hypothetical protein